MKSDNKSSNNNIKVRFSYICVVFLHINLPKTYELIYVLLIIINHSSILCWRYVSIGEKEDVQLFYYFVESTRNPTQDPLILYIPGGPGASALVTLTYEIGMLFFLPSFMIFSYYCKSLSLNFLTHICF